MKSMDTNDDDDIVFVLFVVVVVVAVVVVVDDDDDIFVEVKLIMKLHWVLPTNAFIHSGDDDHDDDQADCSPAISFVLVC